MKAGNSQFLQNDKENFCMAFSAHKIYTMLRNMKINEVEMSILKLPFHCNDNCKKFFTIYLMASSLWKIVAKSTSG